MVTIFNPERLNERLQPVDNELNPPRHSLVQTGEPLPAPVLSHTKSASDPDVVEAKALQDAVTAAAQADPHPTMRDALLAAAATLCPDWESLVMDHPDGTAFVIVTGRKAP